MSNWDTDICKMNSNSQMCWNFWGVIHIICNWYIWGTVENRFPKEFRILNESDMPNQLQSIALENHYHFLTLIWLIPCSIFPIMQGYQHCLGNFKLVYHIIRHSLCIQSLTKEFVAKYFLTQNWCSGKLRIHCPVKYNSPRLIPHAYCIWKANFDKKPVIITLWI